MRYTTIAIIYNPKSTGNSQALAKKLQKDLQKQSPAQKIELHATSHAGHAEKLAYSVAKATKHPLIVSSSGDGGYHEVINGILRAQKEGAQPTAGLLPAGNANDHYHNLHDEDIVTAIIKAETQKIDVLKFEGTSKGKPIKRYAHSYIGMGLTPSVGKELNKHKLNIVNQVGIVLNALFKAKPVTLKIKGKLQRYDSIIFSNIPIMSKVLKVAESSSQGDGKFELTIFRRRNKLKLIRTLLKASLVGLKETGKVSTFSLETVSRTLLQADGEIFELDANSKATITIEEQILTCVV